MVSILLVLVACGDNLVERDFAPCGDLICTGLACDESSQLCTCELGMGVDYVTCDPTKPPTNTRSVCCDLLPDDSAVSRCEQDMAPLPPGTCGVLVCPIADGTNHRINVCGPPG